MQTTLRIINKSREVAGEWFTASVTDYHKKALAECQQEEPTSDWHFETRGELSSWHRFSNATMR